MLKVNNKDTRTTPGVVLVSLLLTLNIFWRRSCIFLVNFEHISQLVLVILLLTLNIAGWNRISDDFRRNES